MIILELTTWHTSFRLKLVYYEQCKVKSVESASRHCSTEMYGPSKGEEIFRDIFIFILMLVILVGNTMIIAAYKKNITLQTGSNAFIVSLAASDWLVGAIAVPLYIVNLRGASTSLLLVRFYISLDIFSGTASVFHLISVTVERYIAISRPFLHHTLLLASYYRVLGVLWFLSLLLSCLDFALTPRVNKNYPFHVLMTMFFVALLIIASLNVLIFKITQSLIRNTVEPAVEGDRNRFQRNLRRERKTAATLTIISGTFFIMWLPHVIGAFVFTFCFPCNLAPVDIGRVGTFVKCMQYANSALNPFIFAFRDGEMRRTIKTMIRNPCLNAVQPLMSSSYEATNRPSRNETVF